MTDINDLFDIFIFFTSYHILILDNNHTVTPWVRNCIQKWVFKVRIILGQFKKLRKC